MRVEEDINRELQILAEISSGGHVTQRSLSKKLGVALGLTNLLIRRLAKKGAIKIVNIQRNRVRYLITPGGISEKARLTYEYLEYSLHFYHQIRRYLNEALGKLDPAAGRRLLLYGTGEIADIAYLIIQQHGLELVGVLDGGAKGQRFLHYPVRALSDVDHATFDYVVVACLAERGAAVLRLQEVGVTADKLIVIPDIPELFQQARRVSRANLENRIGSDTA